MAQDQKKALDEKTKKLGRGGKIEEGKEHAAYQEAQQQLLAIQAEQQQNLAVARAESKASFDNNQTLAQAAELGAISAAEAEQVAQAGGQVTLNPATQQILSKYGAGQPKFQRSQSHSQQVTKQNITINNNITSNTTNDVKVPANVGGPLQGRPLQFKPAADGGSVGKFKTWISAAFARQNEEGAKRDREYRHRESSLTKSANRMMKKLEDIGKTIGSRMDPRKIGSTWQSQLKTLLLLFGFGYLTSNWTKVLDTVSSIEEWVRNTWDYFSKGKFTDSFKEFIGGKENESLITSLTQLFIGEDGLWGRIKDSFNNFIKDRADAIKLIKFPDLQWSDLDNPIEGFKKVLEYLGNVITVAVGGSSAAEKAIGSQIKSEADMASRLNALESESSVKKTGSYKTSEGILKADQGIENIIKENVKGNFIGITQHSLSNTGEINRDFGAEGGYAVSSDILRLNAEAKNGKIKSSELARDFERLYNAAKEEESEGKTGIAVSGTLINKYLNGKETSNFIKSGKIKNIQYYKVLRKKDSSDKSLEGTNAEEALVKAFANKKVADAIGVGDYSPRTLATLTGSTLVGAGTGVIIGGPLGGLIGAYLGKKVGDIVNSAEVRGVIDYLASKVKDIASNDYRVEYVRELRKNDIPILDTNGNNARVTVSEASSEVIQALANKAAGVTSETGPIKIDSTDKTFVTSLESNLRPSSVEELSRLEEEFNKKFDGSGEFGQKEIAYSKGGEKKWWYDKRKLVGKDLNARKRLNESYNEYLSYKERIKELRNNLENNSSNNIQLFEDLDTIRKEREKRNEEYSEKHDNDRWSSLEESASNVAYKISGGSIGTQKLTVDQKSRSKYAIKRFMEEGLTKEQAAGIVGNMMKESSLKPDVKNRDSNGKYAGGIVGWNGDNLKAVEKYFGRDIKNVSFEDQLEYLIKELKGEAGVIRAQERHGFLKKHGFGKGANIMDVMKTTTSLQDSTDTFERIFEGSGDYAGYWIYDNNGNKIKRVEGDRNKRRHELAASVFKNSGGDLSNIEFVEYKPGSDSSTAEHLGETKEEKTAKSFLEIFKEKVASFISNLGGVFKAATDKAGEAVSPITDKIKETVLTDGYHYDGQITKEFTDYDAYLANQGNLPKDLPAGLSYADWKNRVYDMTGSMPQNLDSTSSEWKAEPVKDLREDSKEILDKYSKPDVEKSSESIVSKEQEVATPKVTEIASNAVDITDSPNKNLWGTVFNTQTYEKKEDQTEEILLYVKDIEKSLGQILGVNSANGMIMAHQVDATNNGTRANANAFMNLAKSMTVNQRNQVKPSDSLKNKNNTIDIA